MTSSRFSQELARNVRKEMAAGAFFVGDEAVDHRPTYNIYIICEEAPEKHGPEDIARGKTLEDRKEETFCEAGVAWGRSNIDGRGDAENRDETFEEINVATKGDDDEIWQSRDADVKHDRESDYYRGGFFVFYDFFNAICIIVDTFFGFFDGRFFILYNMNLRESLHAGCDDLRQEFWKESRNDDCSWKNRIENETEKAKTENLGISHTTKKNKCKEGHDEETDLRGDETKNRNNGGIAVLHTMRVHIMNLKRLTANCGWSDVIIISTEKNSACAHAPIWLLSEILGHQDIFVNFCADAYQKENESREQEPTIYLHGTKIGCIFSAAKLTICGPPDNCYVKDDKNDYQNSLFCFVHECIIAYYFSVRTNSVMFSDFAVNFQ